MERAVTPQEAAIVEWMLENAAMFDVTAYRAVPPSALQVCGGCDCGCASIDFDANPWGGCTILADALAVYPDGQKSGLILWGREGLITGLEIYELDPVADRLPEISDLQPL